MDVIMPQLGETVVEGTITAWYKQPGDRVDKGESLFEVETEKVSTEIPASSSGILSKILVAAGVTVGVGTRLAVIDAASKSSAGSCDPADIGDLSDGSTQRSGNEEGVVSGSPKSAQLTPRVESSSRKRLSPVVRRLLGVAGLTADQVQGSGRYGRVTREDVLRVIASRDQQVARSPVAPESVHGDQETSAHRRRSTQGSVVPLNRIRRATAAHMVKSIGTSAHTFQAVEVDFGNVDRVRRSKSAEWKAREGFPLTYLPFVCSAVCVTLTEFPLINSSFDNDSLTVHRRVNLGIAVDLSFQGLVVPVVRDADQLNLCGLAREIHALVEKARNDTLSPAEVEGGTYTISNSGSFGTMITVPIINQPQVAILSLDGVHKKPVVTELLEGDAIAIRPVGLVAQSFDHRAFDGAYSAAFLRRLKSELERRDWDALMS